jgi:hypothetical protein
MIAISIAGANARRSFALLFSRTAISILTPFTYEAVIIVSDLPGFPAGSRRLPDIIANSRDLELSPQREKPGTQPPTTSPQSLAPADIGGFNPSDLSATQNNSYRVSGLWKLFSKPSTRIPARIIPSYIHRPGLAWTGLACTVMHWLISDHSS